MDLTRFDKGGPNTGSYRDIGSVSFAVDDPTIDDSTLCIGFRFLGRDCRDPRNYEFDHVNRFIGNQDPIQVSRSELDDILARQGTNVDTLLSKYVAVF